MSTDPIVDEVRQIRDALAAKFNYDVEAIIDDLMSRQHEINEGHVVVRNAAEAEHAAAATAATAP